jgi:hypothetical protein
VVNLFKKGLKSINQFSLKISRIFLLEEIKVTMQSFIVLALIIITGFFFLMETKRNSMSGRDNYLAFKADVVAGNILQYNDLVTEYILANYETLHVNSIVNPGSVEQVTKLNYQSNQIAKYSQKNLILFLNYSSVSFNYSNGSAESSVLPTLYLATTWDGYASGIAGYTNISIPEIMGAANQLLSKHIYQGDSMYWTIPWLLKQDGQCNVLEVFGQIPEDNTNNSQLGKVKALFNLFCTQIQATGLYKFLTYVYISPVFLPER